ncbi:LADA_0E02718g1_1 [Lachancea dasiensis]|uniref:Protein IBD2 n=1 Tax=Lachancea dasiensis TaxID=1072105 RepID=A0A1G4JAV9_9SACH|nr:LADA_0E02718g1_1 [Lachancea dasiensis]
MPPLKDSSIEVTSKEGPADFHVMMQEGVKALTNILTAHLQDNPEVVDQQSGLKGDSSKVTNALRFHEVGSGAATGVFGASESGGEDQRFGTPGRDEGTSCNTYEGIKLHEHKAKPSKSSGRHATKTSGSLPQNQQSAVVKTSNAEALAENYSDEEGEIVFDCGEQDLMSMPGDFGENLKKMVASRIAQQNADSNQHQNIDINFDLDVDVDVNIQSPPTSAQHGDLRARETCRNHRNREEFEYPRLPKSPPDFTQLITSDKPLCMFCEYYSVFGEPPKNMIRWFQRERAQASSL